MKFTALLTGLCLMAATHSCASKSGDSDKSDQDNTVSKKKSDKETDSAEEQASSSKVNGNVREVVTTLGNEPVFEGSLGVSVLNESLMSVEDLLRKDNSNLPLMVTQLALLRLQGETQDAYKSARARAGGFGAKNPAFLLEASYGAMRRNEFSFADYLISKAQKAGGSDAMVKNAVTHAFGVNAYIQGKRAQGIGDMRKAASSEPSYLPALFTLGFLALKSGDGEGAERYFRSAMAASPNSVNARIGLAAALRVRGKAEESVPLLEPIYKARMNDRRIVWNYALTLADSSNKKGASEVLNRYFSLPDAGKYPVIDDKANALAAKLSAPVASPSMNKVPEKSEGPAVPEKDAPPKP